MPTKPKKRKKVVRVKAWAIITPDKKMQSAWVDEHRLWAELHS